MKSIILGSVIAIASGCGGGGATCTNMVACGAGSYSACGDGARCWLAASDGSRFDCSSCSDCAAATTKAASWCGVPGVRGNGNVDGGSADDGGTATQDPACATWLQCAAGYEPANYPSLLAAYGPNGTCWSSTPAVASDCATACAQSLMMAAADPHSPAACMVDAPTTITLSGDAASGFGPPQTLSVFHCAADDVYAIVANNFPPTSWRGNGQLTLHFLSGTMALSTTNPTQSGDYVYQDFVNGDSPNPGPSGVLEKPVTLSGAQGPVETPGSLTASGGWKCQP